MPLLNRRKQFGSKLEAVAGTFETDVKTDGANYDILALEPSAGFELDTFVPQVRDRVTADGQKTEIEHAPPRMVPKGVIATSFTVSVGETIVVGTSKLNGSGQALIVLFTAMP